MIKTSVRTNFREMKTKSFNRTAKVPLKKSLVVDRIFPQRIKQLLLKSTSVTNRRNFCSFAKKESLKVREYSQITKREGPCFSLKAFGAITNFAKPFHPFRNNLIKIAFSHFFHSNPLRFYSNGTVSPKTRHPNPLKNGKLFPCLSLQGLGSVVLTIQRRYVTEKDLANDEETRKREEYIKEFLEKQKHTRKRKHEARQELEKLRQSVYDYRSKRDHFLKIAGEDFTRFVWPYWPSSSDSWFWHFLYFLRDLFMILLTFLILVVCAVALLMVPFSWFPSSAFGIFSEVAVIVRKDPIVDLILGAPRPRPSTWDLLPEAFFKWDRIVYDDQREGIFLILNLVLPFFEISSSSL